MLDHNYACRVFHISCIITPGLYNHALYNYYIGATTGQLSSIHTNREKVCPGEIVSYRCTTNGSLLAWALPPLDISNLIVFNHNSPPESVISRVQGKVLAVLVTGAPVFESFLIIKPIFNVSFINVTCILGDNNTQLSKVYSIASKSYIKFYTGIVYACGMGVSSHNLKYIFPVIPLQCTTPS